MPPPPLIDLSALDLAHRITSRKEIYAVLPHRHEFMLLDGIIRLDFEAGIVVAVAEVRADDWWTKGHIPDRPLMPGVLMIEAAAQLSSYYLRVGAGEERFLGFTGLDNTKFRDTVTPPSDLIIVNKLISPKIRRFIMEAQAFVNQTMVFEARLTGMIV